MDINLDTKNAGDQETMPSFPLRILTYNIHKGFSSGKRRFILHQIKDALEDTNVDLVFLQEIQGEHQQLKSTIRDWPEASQFEFIADQLWPHYAYAKNAIYTQGHHGNAILSKYPIISWENLNISSSKNASRSLLHGVIRIPNAANRTIHVICIHLGLVMHERQRQLRILSKRIATHVPKNEALILAGDFNDWSGQAEHHLAAHLNLTEVFKQLTGRHARTFPSWWPLLPVDRIYYRGIDAHQCQSHREPLWRGLSDHLPLSAHFLI